MATNTIDAGIPETLKIPAKILYFTGWFRNRSKKLLIFTAAYALLCITLLLMATVQLANMRNVTHFVLNLEMIFSATQMLGKVFVLVYHDDTLIGLLDDTRKFWDAKGQHEEAAAQQTTVRRIVVNAGKAFFIIMNLYVVCLIVSSYAKNILLFGVWTLEGYDNLFRYVMAGQVIYSYVTLILAYTFDCLYLGLCFEMIMQFKIISYNVRDLIGNDENYSVVEEECIEKLKSCMIHLQYMMRFLNKFKKIISLILLFEYVTDAPIILVEFFSPQETASYEAQLRLILAVGVLGFQLSFHCIPADYLSEAVSDVANAAYSSNWEQFLSLRRPLAFVIQNTQKGIVIKAGELVTINSETVLKVFKMAWTACCIMRGLK